METAKLKRFAQYARRSLIEQVSAKLKLVLAKDSAARRELPEAVKTLEAAIAAHNTDHVVEKVAYIWFNRFCALRFMDVSRYTRIGIVSPAEGQFQPEILADAKMGHIDDEMVPERTRQQVFALLDNKVTSRDPQGEAYRLLVVAACNYWNKAMPFLFERIDDFTELLMPDDLLSGSSILAYTREAMTPNVCEDVEVIGWLYQFYISEKKDAVFEGLKKNNKITPENIPAATQLFTPPYIVRYLVENSLGRLWLLNHPDSKLIEKMDYYIKPVEAETDFLRITKPEEIKICDPACGSGHILTYAFDLLYKIYKEADYEESEIPEKILTHNLFGVEIDERAGELAAFALTMKAVKALESSSKRRRFLNKKSKPNICVLENIQFDSGELNEYMDAVGRDLFTEDVLGTLHQFRDADNFGSLIRPEILNAAEVHRELESKDVSGHLFLSDTHQKVLRALQQADILSSKYHVVVANPPYMGSKGMNGRLTAWAKRHFPDSKADLFAMFIDRNLDLTKSGGMVAMITMQSWMFLSTYEALRAKLLSSRTINSMVHLGSKAFDSIGGEVVSTSAFVINSAHLDGFYGTYIDVTRGGSEEKKKIDLIEAIGSGVRGNKYTLSCEKLKGIPGYPIAYMASNAMVRLFSEGTPITDFINSRDGLTTGDNESYIRYHWEVSNNDIGFNCKNTKEFWETSKNFAPLIKGGSYRKWYGNISSIIRFDVKTYAILSEVGNKLPSREFYFRESLNWTRISSPAGSFRFVPQGFVFESASLCAYSKNIGNLIFALSAANSCMVSPQLDIINPTTNLLSGYFDMLRVPANSALQLEQINFNASSLIEAGKSDWDAYETSWDFTIHPLLQPVHRHPTLKSTYQKLRQNWRELTREVQRLEQENNRIFINDYGLKEELNSDVDLGEITLTCNPHYRYGADKSEDELEALLLADTMRELVSYAVGCMFGRFSLDKPGLILANQGETIEDYWKLVPETAFPADDDNVIPMLDGDWFTDDIVERFRRFLRVAFGEAHYEENLRFVESALNVKNKRNYSIQDYFFGEFYIDHVKRYKKRPIYWMFSSPKGNFNALIYMHRYRPETVGIVLNDYLRVFRDKLADQRSTLEAVSIRASSSQSDKTKALKEIEAINKMILEMDDYDRDVLHPKAIDKLTIDLDKGVKHNYPLFGSALKKIVGLDAKED